MKKVEMVSIPKEEYEELLLDSKKLAALYDAGEISDGVIWEEIMD